MSRLYMQIEIHMNLLVLTNYYTC